jgi:hypothetical protein
MSKQLTYNKESKTDGNSICESNDESNDERHVRKCEIPNYLPEPELDSEHSNREDWHNSYKEQLIDIFRIVRLITESEFKNNKIVWDNLAFNNLSRVIYHCSSKNISPYLESNDVLRIIKLKNRNIIY